MQALRLNYINWCVKQLDLSNVRELRLEDLHQIYLGKHNTYKPLLFWTYPSIETAVSRRAELEGFEFALIDPAYRSQRCSQCGLVLKGNRKAKEYRCPACFAGMDSDLNAAINLSLNLPEIPAWVRLKKLNISGFYWNIVSTGRDDIEPYSANLKDLGNNCL
jgi:transposase